MTVNTQRDDITNALTTEETVKRDAVPPHAPGCGDGKLSGAPPQPLNREGAATGDGWVPSISVEPGCLGEGRFKNGGLEIGKRFAN